MTNPLGNKVTCDHFVTSDGASIYFETRGEGQPLLFVYGIGCLLNHWHFQLDYFSNSYQVISFDLRGHHHSTAPVENISVAACAKDILELLNHLGIESAHALGHSFGSQVLLESHALKPTAFRSLTFINGFCTNPISNMFGMNVAEKFFNLIYSQYKKNPEVVSSLWKVSVDNPLTTIATGLLGGFNLKTAHFKDIEIYTRGISHLSLEVFLKLFSEMIHFDGKALAEKIKIPTLIISGESDKVTPVHFQTELASLISGSRHVVVPYGSHCTQLDFPDYVNLKVLEFLKSLS